MGGGEGYEDDNVKRGERGGGKEAAVYWEDSYKAREGECELGPSVNGRRGLAKDERGGGRKKGGGSGGLIDNRR